MLTLKDALTQNRLEEFIEQEEARGVGPAPAKKFDRLLTALIKAPPQEGQTSRFRDGDD